MPRALPTKQLQNRVLNDEEQTEARAARAEQNRELAFLRIIDRHRRRLQLQPSTDSHNMLLFIKALKRVEEQRHQQERLERCQAELTRVLDDWCRSGRVDEWWRHW